MNNWRRISFLFYAKLHHGYESDKKFIPEGNLIEVKFEDSLKRMRWEMTESIYKSLSSPASGRSTRRYRKHEAAT